MESPGAWLLFLLCAFGAEVVGTMAGFGAATILTPVAVLFMDVKTAIAIVACFHLFGNASRLVLFRRHLHVRTWGQFGLIGVAFSVLGAGMTAQLPSAVVQLLLGGFLLLYIGATVAVPAGVALPPTRWTLMGGGMASGFVAGLIGTGGAIRSACLLAFGLPREAYLATSAAIALVVDATRLPVYLTSGFMTGDLMPVVASLIGVAVAGAWVGRRLIQRVSVEVFRRFVLAMLAFMGLKLLAEGWRDLTWLG